MSGRGKFEGLDVLVKKDGVFLSFKSKEGVGLINLEALADGRGKTTGKAIKAWCDEARERATSLLKPPRE
jgi:hypothetical protein